MGYCPFTFELQAFPEGEATLWNILSLLMLVL
jgi:hypothetical protein